MNKPALLLLAAALAVLPAGLAQAQVVRPAPDFAWAPGQTLRSWRGQPVVLVIAPSPLSKEFRAQSKKIERGYQQFAARKVIFVAAFTQAGAENGSLCTNVPFVIAPNGAEIACRYGTRVFSLNVIGRDGNLDLSSCKVESPWKIMDMIRNNAEQQASERKDLRLTPVIQ